MTAAIALHIDGMTCDSCATHVREALERVPGVRSAAVSYPKARAEIAADAGVSSAEGEIYCLERGFVPSRYLRSMGTLGPDGQIALLQSSAAVIGCGGLGGYAAEILARAGVGRLVLVDSDVFDESNLNRQLLATEKTIGLPKAREAARRVEEINGSVIAEERQCRFDDYSAEGILDGIDIALDCLDSLSSRRTLYARCGERNIPVITGAIGGFWGQVGVVWSRPVISVFLSSDWRRRRC